MIKRLIKIVLNKIALRKASKKLKEEEKDPVLKKIKYLEFMKVYAEKAQIKGLFTPLCNIWINLLHKRTPLQLEIEELYKNKDKTYKGCYWWPVYKNKRDTMQCRIDALDKTIKELKQVLYEKTKEK